MKKYGFKLPTTAPKGKKKPKRRTPIFALGVIAGVTQPTAYRQSNRGVYGWVYPGRIREGESAYVDTRLVELVIGREVSDEEIEAAIMVVRARGKVHQRKLRARQTDDEHLQ
jgi:hypothetical protein